MGEMSAVQVERCQWAIDPGRKCLDDATESDGRDGRPLCIQHAEALRVLRSIARTHTHESA